MMKEIWRTIKKNVQLSLSDLDKSSPRTNRELVYGAVACTAVGMLLGILLSPKKTVTIGSNNGNNNGNGNAPSLNAEAAMDEEDEDTEEE